MEILEDFSVNFAILGWVIFMILSTYLLKQQNMFKNILYKSERVGLHGKIFTIWKIRTLAEGADRSHFAQEYTFCGKFLRRFKLDELPQIANIIKGDMGIIGPRPMEQRTLEVIPKSARDVLLSVHPGLSSLASLYFFDEERILKDSPDKTNDYWTKIAPMKIVLDSFYVENKCLSLDIWIAWATCKRIIKEMFK
ncbi:MAG: sugar transferase [Minisyncoccia bacterium]